MHGSGIELDTSHVKPRHSLAQELKRIAYILHQLDSQKFVEAYLADVANFDPNHQLTFKLKAYLSWQVLDLCNLFEAFE